MWHADRIEVGAGAHAPGINTRRRPVEKQTNWNHCGAGCALRVVRCGRCGRPGHCGHSGHSASGDRARFARGRRVGACETSGCFAGSLRHARRGERLGHVLHVRGAESRERSKATPSSPRLRATRVGCSASSWPTAGSVDSFCRAVMEKEPRRGDRDDGGHQRGHRSRGRAQYPECADGGPTLRAGAATLERRQLSRHDRGTARADEHAATSRKGGSEVDLRPQKRTACSVEIVSPHCAHRTALSSRYTASEFWRRASASADNAGGSASGGEPLAPTLSSSIARTFFVSCEGVKGFSRNSPIGAPSN